MKTIELDVFERNGEFVGKKRIDCIDAPNIGKWIAQYREKSFDLALGMINSGRVDFQNQNLCYIKHNISDKSHALTLTLTLTNLIPCCVFFSVRHCIPATWLNDRDQFLYPNEEWQKDSTFQNDCLIFTLFHGQNRITSKEGVNHFIPFRESQVGAKEAFESHFMHKFINGKIKQDSKTQEKAEVKGKQGGFKNEDLYIIKPLIPTKPLEFSAEAQEVFKAGLELWKYYHSQEFKDSANPYNPNASLYDIKAHFQGFSDKGKMNPPQKAQDSYYKDLIGTLNATLKDLAKKIEPKVYEYGFLRE